MLRLVKTWWQSPRKPVRKKSSSRKLLIDGLEPRIMFAGDLDTVLVSSTSASASASLSALNQATNTTNIDLAIEAGIHHLESLLDASNNNIPFFWVWALTRSQAESYGDSQSRASQAHMAFERYLTSNVAGRATYALLAGAEAIGDNLNAQVLDTFEKWVLKSLHKPRNGNWNDLSPANQMITGAAADPRSYGSQQFDLTHLFNIGAGLRGLLGMATLEADATQVQSGYLASSQEMFEVSVYNLRKYYVYGGGTIGGTRTYNWETFRNQLGLQGSERWSGSVSGDIDSNWTGVWDGWSDPFLVYDLVKYYEATGHQPALELAKELRDNAFYRNFPLSASQVDIENGAHMFEVVGEMNAYSRLALVLNDADMMERVRVRYEALRGVGFNSTGWVYEYLNNGRDVGEANNTSELIETALNFAEFGWTQYYQDVERFTRGQLLPSQLLDTSFVVPNSRPANDGQRDIQNRVYGAFGFPAPYGHVATKNPHNTGGYHADVTAGAVATLAEIKKAIHIFKSGVHEINLLFDFDDSQINIRSPYPEGDRLTVTTKVAGDVRVRLPSWVDRSALTASLTQQGLQFTLASDSVLIRGTQVGQAFYVAMVMPFVRTVDRVNGRNITIDWRGDSVFAMSSMGTPMPFFPNVSSTPPTNPPPTTTNLPPVVNAGADRSVVRGTALSLSGTATDDGLPASPGALTVSWSKTSGPGTVTFSNVNSRNTNVQFSAAGQYLLRFTANDGQLSRSDELIVTVTDPISPVTVAFQDGVFPTLSYSGTRDTKISSTSPVSSPGTATRIQLDGTPDMAALMAWDISAIPEGSTILSAAIELFVTNSTIDSYEIYALQRAWEELAATWQQSANGNPWSALGADGTGDAANTVLGQLAAPSLGFRQIALNQAGLELVQAWLDDPADNYGIIFKDYLTGNDAAEIATSETATANQRPKLVVTYMPGSIEEEEAPPVVDPPPANLPPQVNAGIDQSIQLPANVSLAGTVTDDGLPGSPGAVVTTWTRVSGPGTVTFGSAASRNTTASFSVAGTYVLRLTANDGQSQAFDEVTITVQPAPIVNQAPQVNAGADRTIQLPSSVSLAGTVTDDGLPASPGTVGTAWSRVSGPGTVTFGSASNRNTTATFSAAGTYVLRLTASDGQLQSFDEITITVQPAPIVNQAPQVNAGADRSIQLPSSVSLAGTVTDDGQPTSPGAVTTTWTRVSGPGTVTFGSASNRNTTASFSVAGTYVLRLTASDGQLQAFDEVTITVAPPLVQHQPPILDAGPNLQAKVGSTKNLEGVVTFPTGTRPITALWQLTSGPAAVEYGSPNSLNTTVRFTTVGTYILRLTISDGTFTVFDEVTVTVLKKDSDDLGR